MALVTKKISEVPEDAVLLSEEEALNHQREIVNSWPAESEVFFLKYGSYISGAVTFTSSVLILNYYRNVVNVLSKPIFLVLAPSMLVPSYISSMATEKFVTKNILLMKSDCPVCSQLKFAATQCYTSLIFPTFYGLGSYVAFSFYKNTYNYGPIRADPSLFWKQMYKFVKGGSAIYQAAGLVQTILILFLPFMQSKELFNVMERIREIDALEN